jgi:dolichyl-phosphate beta-glucosyltransferase
LADFCRQHPDALSEIIVVDDGSKDATVAEAAKFTTQLPNLKVIRQIPNKGKGAAVRTGVMAATGDYIIFMDADGATGPAELPAMITALQKADIVVGNRWLPGAQTERHSWLRQLSGFTYRTYMKCFGLGNIDTMCGFKGYRRAVAEDLFSHLLEERWLFDTEIAYKSVQKKYSVINLPIKWESKDGSKLPTSTLIKSAFEIWPLIRRINRQST